MKNKSVFKVIVIFIFVIAAILEFSLVLPFFHSREHPIWKFNRVSSHSGYKTYSGNKYYEVERLGIFIVQEKQDINRYYTDEADDGDILLGWKFAIHGYARYYSDTKGNPVFIYEPRFRGIYFRSDYDYTSDTFKLEGTDDKILFSDALKESDFEIPDYDTYKKYIKQIIVEMRSESYSRIRIGLYLFCETDVWYAVGDYKSNIYELTPEFIDVLARNGIIEKE